MQSRCQNTAVIAIAILFVIGFCSEVWRASNISHPPINQNTTYQKYYGANAESQKESAEQAIARYNKWLTIFTAILAVATVGLGFATIGLYFASERQLRLTKEISDRQAVEIQKQIDLTRDEFNASHRPLLVVREVHMFQPTPITPKPGLRFVVANAGSSPADIVASHVTLEFNANVVLLPLQPLEKENAIGPIRILPGDSIVQEHISNMSRAQYDAEEARQLAATSKTYTRA